MVELWASLAGSGVVVAALDAGEVLGGEASSQHRRHEGESERERVSEGERASVASRPVTA